MEKKVIFFLLALHLQGFDPVSGSSSSISSRFDAIWTGIRNLACHSRPVLEKSRQKRSLPLDRGNAKELFRYLYPLADETNVKQLVEPPSGPEDSSRTFFRSPPSRFLSSWLEDVLEFAASECKPTLRKRYRKARSHVRYQGTPETSNTGPQYLSSWHSYIRSPGPWKAPLSATALDKRSGYGDSNASFPIYVSNGSEPAKSPTDEMADDDATDQDDHEYEDDDIEEDEDDDYDSTTSTTEASTTTESTTTTTTASTTTPSPGDPHFASYGGDIEYVLPILSFNVPFDGQITCVGFHGFDGIYNTY